MISGSHTDELIFIRRQAVRAINAKTLNTIFPTAADFNLDVRVIK